MKKYPRSPLALFAAALACTLTSSLHAADVYWQSATTGYWSNPSRWSPATPPMIATDSAYFEVEGTYTVALDSSVALDQLIVGTLTTSGPQLTINTSSFTLSGHTLVSYADTFTHEGTEMGGLNFFEISVKNLVGSGWIQGNVFISGGLTLTGNMTLGNSASGSGVMMVPSAPVTHNIGEHTLTLLDANGVFLNYGEVLIQMAGGQINAANGGSYYRVNGTGQINGDTYISYLDVYGDFTLGNAASTDGAVIAEINYFSNGEVTLRDADRAMVVNVDFGIGPGRSLRAANGLEFIGGLLTGTGTIGGHALFYDLDPDYLGSNLIQNAEIVFENGMRIAGPVFAENAIISSVEGIEVDAIGRLYAENSSFAGAISGSGTITAISSDFGDASSSVGFDHDGAFSVTGRVNLFDADTAGLGTTTTLNGGNTTLSAENGFWLAAGREITGAGLIFGEITGDGNVMERVQGSEVAAYTENIDAGAAAITMLSSETASLSARLTLNGNTATSEHGLRLASTGSIVGHGTFVGELQGLTGSSIRVSGGTMTLGDANSYTGFSTAGTIDVGANTLNLRSAGFASLGSLTRVQGGTLHAANGVYVGGGSNLVGYGTVSGKIAAGVGSIIAANGGDLTLGNASAVDGFYSDGVLKTGNRRVTLLDRNQAVLGSLTELGDASGSGELVAANGFLLQAGRNLVGYGDVTGVFNNQGDVEGVGIAPGDGITFHSLVKGNGSFSGNIAFGGGYTPGNSPAIVNMGNTTFLAANVLTMEIGGLTPGPGTPTDNGYDQLLFGSNTVVWGGELEIVFINGFAPELGQSFNLFDFDIANASGSFTFDTMIGGGLWWDTSELYTTGVVTVIPEPSTFLLLAGSGLALLGWKRRKAA